MGDDNFHYFPSIGSEELADTSESHLFEHVKASCLPVDDNDDLVKLTYIFQNQFKPLETFKFNVWVLIIKHSLHVNEPCLEVSLRTK